MWRGTIGISGMRDECLAKAISGGLPESHQNTAAQGHTSELCGRPQKRDTLKAFAWSSGPPLLPDGPPEEGESCKGILAFSFFLLWQYVTTDDTKGWFKSWILFGSTSLFIDIYEAENLGSCIATNRHDPIGLTKDGLYSGWPVG